MSVVHQQEEEEGEMLQQRHQPYSPLDGPNSPSTVVNPPGSPEVPGFWYSLYRILRVCWSWTTSLLVVFEFVLCVTFAWAFNFYSTYTGDWTTAVMSADYHWLERSVGFIVFGIVVGGLANGAIMFLGEVIMLSVWNARLTKHLISQYMKPLVYYRVLEFIPDPDQRLGTEVTNFCARLKVILFGTPLLVGLPPGLLAIVASVIWLTITLAQQGGWFCCVGTYAFFLFFAIINQILLFPASAAMKAESKRYSSYRFAHGC